MKRLISLLLAGILIFSLVPAQVLATDGAEDAAPSEEATVPTVMLMTDPVNNSDGDDSEGDDDADPSKQAEAETPDAPKSVWKVTFNPTNGSESTIMDVENESTVEEPAKPEKEGFIFGGWYDENGKEWNFGTPVTHNVNLTAKWKVTVTFDTKGGTPVPEQEIFVGGKVTEPTTTNGERFLAGWFDSNNILWNFKEDKVDVNTTLTAKWLIKVTFMDGNTQLKEIGVDNGSKLTQADLPVNPNLEFAGLYKDAELKTAWDFDNDKVTETTTLYTKWQVKVTFKKDTNGAIVGEKILDIGSTIREFDNPTKKDLVFDGLWYEGFVSPSKVWDLKTKPVYTNTTLVAGWFAEVTFDANGGSFGSTTTEKTYVRPESTANAPTNPDRPDFSFGGWYDKDGNAWTPNSTKVPQNITVYAKWNTQVTFVDSENGTTLSTKTVAENGTVDKPDTPEKDGYVFGGWYKEDDLSNQWNFDSDTVKGPTVLYAKWLDAVTVRFNSNGGNAIEPEVVAKNGTVTAPAKPTRSGYLFDGWYWDPELRFKWDFASYAVKSDITLHAKWLDAVTVSFNSNGGSAVTAQTIEKNTKATKPVDPARDGFLFAGWYADAELKNLWNFDHYRVPENITLHARWLDAVTVTFDSNGGSTVTAQTVLKNGIVTEPAEPTRTNFVFDGWYMDAELKTKWNFAFFRATENITLYAGWKVKVEFVTGTDGSAVAPQLLNVGSKVTKPADPVKSNARFLGWYRESAYTNVWDFTKDTVSKNTKLYAKWEKNPLAINAADSTLYPGESTTLTVKYNNEDVSTKVTWSISGNTDKDTKFNGTKLTIGDDEKGGPIKVTAAIGEYRSDYYVTICPTYEFKSGAGSKWAQKSTKNLTFECNGPMEKIDKIKIGSTEVKEENYTLSESTNGFKLVLKSAAMSGLSVKEYDLTITFDDGGKAETTFEVIKESDIPETGDFVSLPLWCTLLAVTAAAALMLKKRQA